MFRYSGRAFSIVTKPIFVEDINTTRNFRYLKVLLYLFAAFKCSYCDRRYTQNADLNKHLRTHLGQNTYKCNLCDNSFRLLCDLRRHTSEHYQQSLAHGTDSAK